ncbi:MAG: YbaN family protein [Bacteroidales bacterium]
MLLKALYIALGSISLGLGVLGIFLPGLPTTPFLLLTTWLYAKSSRRLHQYIVNHKWFGPYIKNFSKGISVRVKIRSIMMMWGMIALSAYVFIENPRARIILFGVGVIGMIVMIMLPGPKPEE